MTLKKIFGKDFIKFAAVGAICTLINYLIFYCLLDFLHTPYLLASAVGYIAGVAIGYLLNKMWTFGYRGSHTMLDIAKYLGVYAYSLLSGLILLYVFVDVFGIHPKLGNILIIGYTAIANFLGVKYLVFVAKRDDGY